MTVVNGKASFTLLALAFTLSVSAQSSNGGVTLKLEDVDALVGRRPVELVFPKKEGAKEGQGAQDLKVGYSLLNSPTEEYPVRSHTISKQGCFEAGVEDSLGLGNVSSANRRSIVTRLFKIQEVDSKGQTRDRILYWAPKNRNYSEYLRGVRVDSGARRSDWSPVRVRALVGSDDEQANQSLIVDVTQVGGRVYYGVKTTKGFVVSQTKPTSDFSRWSSGASVDNFDRAEFAEKTFRFFVPTKDGKLKVVFDDSTGKTKIADFDTSNPKDKTALLKDEKILLNDKEVESWLGDTSKNSFDVEDRRCPEQKNAASAPVPGH